MTGDNIGGRDRQVRGAGSAASVQRPKRVSHLTSRDHRRVGTADTQPARLQSEPARSGDPENPAVGHNGHRRSVTVADFEALGQAFVTLYLQGLNGVVCDPDAEPGRYGCPSCLGAWAKGKEVLDKYDEGWGNMFRRPSFRVGGKRPDR